MPILEPYQLARVVQLRYPIDGYVGWGRNQRPPAIGDMGTVIDILRAPGLPDKYVVEASGVDGITIWLADFDADELAPIADADYMPPRRERTAGQRVVTQMSQGS